MSKIFLKYILRLSAVSFLLLAGSLNAAVVDVLVLYLDDAEQTTNGRDIDARIASYIEFSNQAYINSNVDIQLRLVGAERINDNYTFVNSGNLTAFRSNQTVARLRSQTGADLVTLLNLRQPTNGGYVCGIGYVPPGDDRTGSLYSNAPSLGFSLVGVDCGLNTFTHELGHNMSLGHSVEQGSEGGVFPWARGYGVSGVFSTVMAYPQAFGTRNQLPVFSNPGITRCEGLSCGVSSSRGDGADSAQNLNRLATQIAAFVPEVTSGGGDTGSGDGGSDDGGETPEECPVATVSNNLIENGSFSSLNGWDNLFNAAELNLANLNGDCLESVLLIGDRSQFYGGAFQDLTGKVLINKDYDLKAQFAVQGVTRDTIRMVLRIQEGSAVRYQELDSISATNSALSDYDSSFSLDASSNPTSVGLFIFGPEAGVDIIVDNVSLVDTTVPPENTRVIDEQFEGSAQGWGSYFQTSLAYSSNAAQGDLSVFASNRANYYSGPGYTATGLLDNNRAYTISTQMNISSSASTESAQIWVYMVDNSGGNWTKLSDENIPTNSWETVTADLTLTPNGSITQLRIHVFGPQPNADFYIDNFFVEEQ